jgi:hypothetical protein
MVPMDTRRFSDPNTPPRPPWGFTLSPLPLPLSSSGAADKDERGRSLPSSPPSSGAAAAAASSLRCDALPLVPTASNSFNRRATSASCLAWRSDRR